MGCYGKASFVDSLVKMARRMAWMFVASQILQSKEWSELEFPQFSSLKRFVARWLVLPRTMEQVWTRYSSKDGGRTKLCSSSITIARFREFGFAKTILTCRQGFEPRRDGLFQLQHSSQATGTILSIYITQYINRPKISVPFLVYRFLEVCSMYF